MQVKLHIERCNGIYPSDNKLEYLSNQLEIKFKMRDNQKRKVLFIANHRGFSKFNAPYMQWFQQQGWQVDNASPGIMVDCIDNQYDVDILRSPFSIRNFKAYLQLKKIIEENDYNIIHVHTPMGAFLGRLAAKKARKKGTKVIYTAHGFHFFKGSKKLNWMLYYPIELLQADDMDAIVTINQEDFELAQKKELAHGNVFKIDGVGVNLTRFVPLEQKEIIEIRNSINLSQDDFVILYTSQFVVRKNHRFIIDLIPTILKSVPNAKFVFVGGGPTEQECKNQAKSLGVYDSIRFLGFRSDVPNLCGISDLHVSASMQEGQGINNIEAMATGCPLVISNIRGHRDVCVHGRNGYLYALDKPQEFVGYVIKIAKDKNLRLELSKNNIKDAQKFSIEREVEEMAKIYKKLM